MSALASHHVPADLFHRIATGGGGPEAIALLASTELSRRLMLIVALIRSARAVEHPEAASAARAYSLLARVRAAAPDAWRATMAHPSVGLWAMRTVRLLQRGHAGEARPGYLALIAAAAVVRARLPIEVELPPPDCTGRISLPSLGTAALDASTASAARLEWRSGPIVRAGRDVLAVGSADPRWHPLAAMSFEAAGLRLTLSFDSLAWTDLAPDVASRAILPEEFDRATWRDRLEGGWRELVAGHRAVAEEVAAAVSVVMPLRPTYDEHTSWTFADAFGCVAMSLPSGPVSTAVAFAHEIQHAKLSALMGMYAFVEPGTDDRYYAPWRDDPRPLGGLLQGLYAHLGVVLFWERRCRAESDAAAAFKAEVEFVRWRDAALEVGRVLHESGRLATVGQRFTAEVVTRLEQFSTRPVSTRARRTANRLRREHRRRWMTVHQPADAIFSS